MSRFAVLALLIACGNGSKPAAEQQKAPAPEGEKIAVPGAARGAADPALGGPGAAPTADDPAAKGIAAASDPRFHLKPEEGTLAIDKGEAKAGAEATASLKLTPNKGYKLATDYPIKIQLEAPAGVTVAKTELTAGGRNKVQGDAATLTEKEMAFAIKATADKPGSYEIKGVFKFGICFESDVCHPKKQPITITVAAN